MSFKEEFPSLNRKECYVDEFEVGEIPEREILTKKGIIKIKLAQEPNTFRGRTYIYLESDKVYQEKHIQKHCIDKQRVKEAIDNAIKYNETKEVMRVIKIIKELLKL